MANKIETSWKNMKPRINLNHNRPIHFLSLIPQVDPWIDPTEKLLTYAQFSVSIYWSLQIFSFLNVIHLLSLKVISRHLILVVLKCLLHEGGSCKIGVIINNGSTTFFPNDCDCDINLFCFQKLQTKIRKHTDLLQELKR